jgi:hypothetical protein
MKSIITLDAEKEDVLKRAIRDAIEFHNEISLSEAEPDTEDKDQPQEWKDARAASKKYLSLYKDIVNQLSIGRNDQNG